MTTGIELIAAERKRQVEDEGWSSEHDDEHDDGSLVQAAIAYAAEGQSAVIEPDLWPASWSAEWDKRGHIGVMRCLVIAGALIAAEIDRLSRADPGRPVPPRDRER